MISDGFRRLSARIGADPMLVQGPGGNTSVKSDGVMWVKASGTELADASDRDIFVAVDRKKVLAAIDDGDGGCLGAVIDGSGGLRPSIETTFHALLPHRYVFHFHSVHAIAHGISPQGRAALDRKLAGMDWVSVPYRKPGLPLTKAIAARLDGGSASVFILDNHGAIVGADDLEVVEALMADLEERLLLDPQHRPGGDAPAAIEGWEAAPDVAALALDDALRARALAGSYYPDHVVFLGPALPSCDADPAALPAPDTLPFPAIVCPRSGIYLKSSATPAQRAMLQCLFDVLSRIPSDWSLEPIGAEAERELLNWDAEKYRQALAERTR